MEFGVDLLDLPIFRALILDPFKVRDNNTTSVGEDIGDYVDVFLLEDFIGPEMARAIGTFDDDASLHIRSDLRGDLEFKSSRYHDVGFSSPELILRALASARVALDGAVGDGPFAEFVGIDPLGIANGAADVDTGLPVNMKAFEN